jgi:hypothetical protein
MELKMGSFKKTLVYADLSSLSLLSSSASFPQGDDQGT